MTIFILLAGIVIAGAMFAATLWSVVQIFRQTGRLRFAHVAVLAATLGAMSALSYESYALVRIAGAALTVTGGFAVYADIGWNRVLPLFQFAFGLALVMGLPFVGG